MHDTAKYRELREAGVSHARAMAETGMPRKLSFAAARLEGMSEEDAAVAVGYAGRGSRDARALFAAAVSMQEWAGAIHGYTPDPAYHAEQRERAREDAKKHHRLGLAATALQMLGSKK